jgi:hypothetical protein
MSLFIPGRTSCGICGKPIPQRMEAALLPLINPSQHPQLAPLAWRFAHRSCWESHPKRDVYAQAARELILKGNPQQVTPLQFERDGLFLLSVPAARAVRIKDTWGPLEADIPAQEAAGLADAIISALTQQVAAEHSIGNGAWKLAPSKAGMVLMLVSQGEPFERMEIPRERQEVWKELAGKLRRV